MRNKVNVFARNTLKLIQYEFLTKLEEQKTMKSIFDKQEQVESTTLDIINIAEHAPKGLIEVIFAKHPFNKTTPPEKIMMDINQSLHFYNTTNPEDVDVLFRTVIVVDNNWSERLRVFRTQYGFSNKHLESVDNEELG